MVDVTGRNNRLQFTRKILSVCVPPILVAGVFSIPEFNHESFPAAMLFNVMLTYVFAALYGGICHITLRFFNFSKTWWQYCLLMFFISFAVDVLLNVHGLHVYTDLTFGHTILVKSGELTAEGQAYAMKEALSSGVLYSLGLALFFLIRGKKLVSRDK